MDLFSNKKPLAQKFNKEYGACGLKGSDGLSVTPGKEIIKTRSRQHEHTSQCDGPAGLTSERGAVNSWFPFIDGVSLPTTSR
jgi:hypothetical protein